MSGVDWGPALSVWHGGSGDWSDGGGRTVGFGGAALIAWRRPNRRPNCPCLARRTAWRWSCATNGTNSATRLFGGRQPERAQQEHAALASWYSAETRCAAAGGHRNLGIAQLDDAADAGSIARFRKPPDVRFAFLTLLRWSAMLLCRRELRGDWTRCRLHLLPQRRKLGFQSR